MAVVAGIAVGIGAVSTAASIDSSKRAARRQKRASQITQNTQIAAEREKKFQTQRERDIRRARIIASAENTGTTGSSGLLGALGGANTLAESNLAFNRAQTLGNIQIGNLNQQAANAMTKANTYQAIGSLAFSVANFSAANAGGTGGTPAPVETLDTTV